jgi:hypothetical protein
MFNPKFDSLIQMDDLSQTTDLTNYFAAFSKALETHLPKVSDVMVTK